MALCDEEKRTKTKVGLQQMAVIDGKSWNKGRCNFRGRGQFGWQVTGR